MTALKAVRRVSQPLIFDLRDDGDEGSGSVRMVEMLSGVADAASEVEFFHMDTDEENDEETMAINTAREGETLQSASMDEEWDGREFPIIVDSGADASLFPGHLMGRGVQGAGASLYLQDAQGSQIKTYGHKDVDIVLTSRDGRKVILKERVTFCDVVKQPILSFGRLMRAGWSIDGMDECLKNGDVEVPLNYQNQSLVVQGSARISLSQAKFECWR